MLLDSFACDTETQQIEGQGGVMRCTYRVVHLHGCLLGSLARYAASIQLGFRLQAFQCMLQQVIQHSNAVLQASSHSVNTVHYV